MRRHRPLLALLAALLAAACGSAPPARAPAPRSCEPAQWSATDATPLLDPAPVSELRGERWIALDWRWDEVGVAPLRQAAVNRPGDECAIDAVLGRQAAALDLAVAATGRTDSCTYVLRATDLPAAAPVTLGPVPPRNRLAALARRGSAVWAALQANGYARDLPAGGNVVVAADLCTGVVRWSSGDLTSNGPLLTVGDAVVTAYGFTAEPDHLYVLDAARGAVVQSVPLPSAAEALALTRERLWVKTYDAVLSFRLLRPASAPPPGRSR